MSTANEPQIQVLLVEDTLTQAMLFQHQLERSGISTRVARSGMKALETLKESRPRLVLSDINMPEMSGYELCRAIKGNPETEDLTFVLLGTALKTEEIVEIVNCGADDFLLKNLEEEALVARVKRALARSPKIPGREKQNLTVGIDGRDHDLEVSAEQMSTILVSLYDMLCLKSR
ncbi:MAG: response regulator [Candidatus Obscuribacterales bacterium]